MVRGWFFALGLVLVPASVSASELGDAAGALQPGEWAEFQTVGYGHDLLDACDGSHSIYEWANKGVWDPERREVRFVGQGHYSCRKQIRLDEVTNAWDQPPEPSDQGIGHAYEHNAIDPATGESFYRQYGSMQIDAFDPDAETWSPLPQVPAQSVQVGSAIEYFPEAGGLLFADSVAGVWLYSGDWSQLETQIDTGPYNIWAVHNPAHGIVLLGGGNGSTSVYLVDGAGSVSKIGDSPEEFGIARAAVIADPATGNYLAFADSGSVYELDPEDLDTGWWEAGTHPVMDYARDWRVYVPISTHGVIMALTWDFDASNILLYRHAETEPPPEPPDDDSGDGDASSGDDGSSEGGETSSPTSSGDSAEGPGAADEGPGGEDGESGGGGASGGDDNGGSGCGCQAPGSSSWGWLSLLVVALRRRSTRACA